MNIDPKIDAIRDKAEDVKRGVGAAIENATDAAGEFYDRAKSRVRTLGEDGVEYVRENPVKTIITALAVGFVAGLALRH